MKAVILIGGKGTRLRPLTINTPKAIVPVLNRPFLEHMLRYLKGHGVAEVILALNYLPETVRERLGDGSHLGVRIVYVIEEPALGTAGAVKNAEAYLDETFFVLNGDMVTSIDLTEMFKLHRQAAPKASIALIPVANPSIYGVVETDERHMVKRFLEKPGPDQITTNLINAGIYILEPEVLADIPAATYTMFENYVFPKLLETGQPVLGYPSSAYWLDIGAPDKYLAANHNLLMAMGKDVRAEGDVELEPAAAVEGPTLLGNGCVIESGAKIKGPTVLGQRCKIAAGAIIAGSVLWDDVQVDPGTVIKDSILAYRCRIEEGCRLEDCVLGDDITIGKGNRLAGGTRLWPNSVLGAISGED